jgi:hypothetical protein
MRRKGFLLFFSICIFSLCVTSLACKNPKGSSDDTTKFEGTWTATSGLAALSTNAMQIVFDGYNITYIKVGINDFKGTFTFTETEIEVTTTHLWDPGENKWVDNPTSGSIQYIMSATNNLEIVSVGGFNGNPRVGIYAR